MGKSNEKQQKILEYIRWFTKEHKYPPSVREIGAAVNLRSPSTVHMHIKSLIEKGYLRKDANKTRALILTDAIDDDIGVPIIGRVTAGAPILAFEEQRGVLAYKPHGDGEFFALEVRGDSMINAGILDGDYVIVRKQSNARNGQIVVALLEDEATVKRLMRSDGEIWLLAENPRYEPIDGSYCQILGVVTSLVRDSVV
ncbi:MAG: transcriptional repressor LexA [Oscillospiraceae bacterium]|jgi:repressor LexA|nr:transcriptional repressor LexA [Oscillospiraceae bacterium]